MTDRSFRDDILAQPENLRLAGETFLPALGEADLHAFDVEPVVLAGMGASFFALVPAAAELRSAGKRALMLSPSEILQPGGERLGAAHVALSQSGRSAETVAAMRRVRPPRLALTTTGTGPLAEACDLALPIGSKPDAGVSVLTYTASLFAGAALGSALGGRPLEFDAGEVARLVAELCPRVDGVAERAAERFAQVRAIDAVAQGSSFGSAGYAALLIREAARMPSAAFDTQQYLHGPIEVAEPGAGAVVFGNGREVQLARDLAAAGTEVLLVTSREPSLGNGIEVILLPPIAPSLRPILEAISAQLVADHLAQCLGLRPGDLRREQPDTKLPER